jgi:hypothetical protein
MTSQKTFDQMNAREKTEFLGFRSYSEREQKIREKMFTQRGSDLTIHFLKTLLAQEELMIARDLSEQQREKYYVEIINNMYDYAVNNDYTMYDLESVARNLQDLGTQAERMLNFAVGEPWKLSYALTGENKLEYVPLKKIMDLTKVAKDVFPKDAIVDDVVEELKTVDSAELDKLNPTV